MKIVLTGSLGNISKPLTEILVNKGHQVSVITSSTDKKAAIEALGATAMVGSVNDISFLTQAFSGADAIYTMVPNNFAATDTKAHIAGVGANYAEAIKAAGVKRVVNLSSIGAHLPSGTGPITGLHRVEQSMNKLEDVAIKHLRPSFFYINFYNNVDMIKHAGIMGSNYSADTKIVLVHPRDIAEAAAEELQGNFTGHSVRYVASDERNLGDVVKVLGNAIGKPELPWITFSNEDALNGMIQAGMPQDLAKNYVEMGVATGDGSIQEEYFKNRPVLGKTKLEDFAKEFAQAFN